MRIQSEVCCCRHNASPPPTILSTAAPSRLLTVAVGTRAATRGLRRRVAGPHLAAIALTERKDVTMYQRVVDLSLALYHGMQGVELRPQSRFAEQGSNTTNLLLFSHAGTHLDAPYHFLGDGRTVDRLELSKCVGPALLIDLSHKPPDSLITLDDLKQFQSKIGPGSRLLLRTDWDKHAAKPDYRTSFPRISLELAEWMAERGVWLLGIEAPAVASLQDREELKAVHRALLRSEIVIVESLANLRDLAGEDVFFIALPLRIEGCDGSPVRAIAIEGETTKRDA
jgi:kynurenine formamidase